MLRILLAGSLMLGAVTTAKIDGKPFNASVMDLAKQGYVEEEFVISGTARTVALLMLAPARNPGGP